MSDRFAGDQLPDRAEQAFRDAFARQASGLEFEPMRIDVRRRPAWGRSLQLVAGAAAAVVTVGVVAAVALQLLGTGTSASSASSVMAAPAAAPAAGSAQAREQADVSTVGGLPPAALEAPKPGWRYESFADIVVQVPADWGYGSAPASDWCADQDPATPPQPFVDLRRGLTAVRAILCQGTIPANRLGMYLSFGFAGSNAAVDLPAGWGLRRTTVGDAVATVVFPDAQDALADEILRTVTRVQTDHNNCAATSPIQSSTFQRPEGSADLGELSSIDELDVCQYDVQRKGPGLLASTKVTGTAAAAALAALKKAPSGAGPDNPADCLGTGPDGTALVLRLVSGGAVSEVYAYYAGCRNNGFFGPTQARTLTRDACAPLVRPPVTVTFGNGPTVALCRGDAPPKK